MKWSAAESQGLFRTKYSVFVKDASEIRDLASQPLILTKYIVVIYFYILR